MMAHSSYGESSLTLGAGLLSPQPGNVQINNEGEMNGISLKPYLDLGYNMSISNHFSMLYDLGWVLAHQRSSETISRNCYFLNMHLALHWGGFTKFGFLGGGGLYLTSITGQGGSIILNNGTSTTPYPLPFNTSLGSNLTLNFGSFLRVGIISVEGMITTFNVHDSAKMMHQFSVTAKIHIPIGSSNSNNIEVRQSKPNYQAPEEEYNYDQNNDFF